MRHGWIPGQGLGKGNADRVVPVELTSMSLHSPQPLTQPPNFVAPRERIGFPIGLYSRPIDYIRPNTYPFVVTDETGRAWDHAPIYNVPRKSFREAFSGYPAGEVCGFVSKGVLSFNQYTSRLISCNLHLTTPRRKTTFRNRRLAHVSPG